MAETIETLRKKIPPVQEGKYLLGFSGGADSVALMMLLLPAIRAKRIRVEAVHVNHGLRGTESDDDERFCYEFCKKMKLLPERRDTVHSENGMQKPAQTG